MANRETENLVKVAEKHGLTARNIAEEGISEHGYWEFVLTTDGKRITNPDGTFAKVSRRWPSSTAAAEVLDAFAAKLEAEGR